MSLLQLLQQKLRNALEGLVADPGPYALQVKPTQEARFGDYQANCAMSLARELGRKPRDLAQEIARRLDPGEVLEPPEIAGPGFINLRLRTSWLAERIRQLVSDPRLGVHPASPPRTFVIDYSSPNVAKPMHVGHLRSTILGDALARMLRFLGHTVISDNHLGDWGTQFGMLLYGYKHFRDEAALAADPVREMVRLYLHVRTLMKASDDDEEEIRNPVADACREETAKLHAGDPENLRLWEQFMPWCRAEIDRIYRRLDVQFDQTLGESFYNAMLPGVVTDFLQRGLAERSNRAVIIPFGDGKTPALIQKSDGAFTYMTSDLATIRYRVETWNPDVILYVVDFRQGLHFQNLFEAARRWGYTRVTLEHVSFGSVLGPDRKPIKTREGGAVELSALLDEAVARARRVVDENSPDLTSQERERVAQVVGIGAVKYADLSQNRTSDYAFNWDKMLAMDGNTATYMQYAYARNRSIFRKGNENPDALRTDPPPVCLDQLHERALALELLRLPDALEAAVADYRPNLLTNYLWDLAKTYSGFFQNCPVLTAETALLRRSRLALCDITARTIQLSLGLLGIGTVERM